MSLLNVMCAICSEFYKTTDTVYSTTVCGHLFHMSCLFRWLQVSGTCPQCRKSCHRNRVHRVFLNYGERTAADEELDAAMAEVPNWTLLDLPVSMVPQSVPKGAIKSGTDADGNDAYVARVYFDEDLLPANYVPQLSGVFISWGCNAHFQRSAVELLVECNCEWVAATNGAVPPNAIATGYTDTGETLYTGRAQYEGLTLPGKVHPSHKVLYMPFKEKEVNSSEYEVLVQLPKETTATTTTTTPES